MKTQELVFSLDVGKILRNDTNDIENINPSSSNIEKTTTTARLLASLFKILFDAKSI